MTAEQQARDMLERMGVREAQAFSAGDVVELANLIATLAARDKRVLELEAEQDALNKRLVEVIRNHDVIGLAYEQRERGDSPFGGIGTPNALLAAQGGSDAGGAS